MNRKVLSQIIKRLFLVMPVMIVTGPFGMLWVAMINTKVPWIDPLLDWAIDAPITAYEKMHGTGSFFGAVRPRT